MKLRKRVPLPPEGAWDVDEGLPVPRTPRGRAPLKTPSTARSSRAAATPRAAPASRPVPQSEPTRSRARPRAAPKGGVQKRKVGRPTGRLEVRQSAVNGDRAGAAAAAAVAAISRMPATKAPSKQSRRRAPSLAADQRHANGKLSDEELAKSLISDDEDVVDGKGSPSEETKQTTTIDDLPEEVMLGVFSYFRPPQLCWKIGRVCRRWAEWSVSRVLWKDCEYTMSPDPDLSRRNK